MFKGYAVKRARESLCVVPEGKIILRFYIRKSFLKSVHDGMSGQK